MDHHQVAIIGAGITGLTAAYHLQKQNIDFILIEADSQVGGRVQSKKIDNYTIDKGFQVLLTAYPEAQKLLDYDALNLRNFDSGALLLLANGQKSILGDPFRQLKYAIPSLLNPSVSFSDKLKVNSLKNRLKSSSIEDIFKENETTTLEKLKNLGFSEKAIHHFFKPFFSGIFLENELNTSSRMFEFVFKMFSEGFAALPQNGIQAIPNQIASHIQDSKKIKLKERVTKIRGQVIETDKNSYQAEKLIIATNPSDLLSLDNQISTQNLNQNFVSTTQIYFLSDSKPYSEPLISLNTLKSDISNNISVLTNVQAAYGNPKNLISVSYNGGYSKNSESRIKSEMSQWFKEAKDWDVLTVENIKYALPNQKHVNLNQPFIQFENQYLVGDYLMNGSLNAAMYSGRKVAEEILNSTK